MPNFAKFFAFLFFIAAINFFALWFLVFRNVRSLGDLQTRVQQLVGQEGAASIASSLPSDNVTQKATESSQLVSMQASQAADLADITARLSTLEDKVTALEKRPASTTTTTTQSSSSKVKEYFVYLGTGSTTKTNWTDITSAEATIDTSQYSNIKSVVFEAGLSILGGEAHARLKNKSSGAILNNTEIYHNGSTTTWKTSSTMNFHSGSNQYIVQLKSTSSETANLDGSRIKITVY